MPRFRLTCLLAACVLGQAGLAQEVPDLAALLEPIRAEHEVPALGAAIVAGGELQALGVTGLRALGSPEPVAADDLWHLGSCTKSMTASLIALLVEEGTLSWQLTLAEAFPDLTLHADYVEVDLAQLLSHTAGCPADLSFDGLWGKLWRREGSPQEQRMQLVEAVLQRAPAQVPGDFLYSNAGVAIAGAIAERAAATPFEQLLAERLFEPLGMDAAGFGAPGDAAQVDQPRGHTGLGARAQPINPGEMADNPPAIAPAGTVHASLRSWARYVAMHASRNQLLSEESFARLHTPPPGGTYALGWGVTKRPWGGTVLTHSGSNTLWYAVTWIAPELDFAVLVTCNIGGDAGARACDAASAALIEHFKAGE